MRIAFAYVAALSLTFAGCGEKSQAPSPEDTAKAAATKAMEDEATAVGVEAVVYGLPLVVEDITRRKTSNVAAPTPTAMSAPVNQFVNLQEFPNASFKDVVRANVDTLYSNAWLDLTKEPMILSVPDTHGRYYLMPMLDAWTNVFASPGKRTTGTKAGIFAITEPGWSGTLPKGVRELKSPTNYVWIIGRTQTNGPRDYAAVHAIQKQYKLTPLSSFGKPYSPPPGVVDSNVDMKTPPVEQLAKMDAATFFGRMATLMKVNPPPAADAPVVAKLAKIGIVPGQNFDIGKLDPAVAKGLEKVVPTALDKLQAAAKQAGAPVNGWNQFPNTLGKYGTDYGLRAVIALLGLGANLTADAVYPTAFIDSTGQPLNGANRYTMHFDKGQTPPVNAFWSLTMYDAASFFADNPINRYNLAGWMPLKYNKDGSLDLYIQRESPGKDKQANWLPAAQGDFSVTNRMYWPKAEVVDGTWRAPGIVKVQ